MSLLSMWHNRVNAADADKKKSVAFICEISISPLDYILSLPKTGTFQCVDESHSTLKMYNYLLHRINHRSIKLLYFWGAYLAV